MKTITVSIFTDQGEIKKKPSTSIISKLRLARRSALSTFLREADVMGNRCSIQQSEESNCWLKLEQSPENRLYRLFRSFWATLYMSESRDWTDKLWLCGDVVVPLKVLNEDII